MPGVIPRFEHGGPVTYTVNSAVKGGQMVQAVNPTNGKVEVAGAASIRCLGIATKDARPAASASSTDSDGFPVVSTVEITPNVAVGMRGIWPVTFAANAAFGDVLICAANGQVTPAGATPDARTIVGRCVDPAGVLAGAVGLVRLPI